MTTSTAGSDRSDPAGESVAFAQRFVIVHRHGGDLAGVRFPSGRVIADELDGGLQAGTCWWHLAQRYVQATLVWEGDDPPAECCPDGPHEAPAGSDAGP